MSLLKIAVEKLPPSFQESEDWNQQAPETAPSFLPQLKPGMIRLKAKLEGVKGQPVDPTDPTDPTSVPPSGSSGVEDEVPKSSMVSQLVKKGRVPGSRLVDQKRSPHGRRRQFNCSYCDYASVRRYNTERHIRLRHPTYRYKVRVFICGSESSSFLCPQKISVYYMPVCL